MSDPEAKAADLQRELEYYRHRLDEASGDHVRLEYEVVSLRYRLAQSRRAFTALLQLQRATGLSPEASSILESALHVIRANLSVDRAVILSRAESERLFRPSHWAGFPEEVEQRLGSLTLDVPSDLYESGGIVVNSSTDVDELVASFRAAFEVPYFVCVPIGADDAPSALLVAGRAREDRVLHRPLDEADVATFRSVAASIATAIQVAFLIRQREAELRMRERLETELQVARVIQEMMLPKGAPNIPGWQLSAFYRSAREVGGDFYDYIALPDGRLGLVVGDVTDKGVPAAMVMAATRSLLKATAHRVASPSQVLQRVNDDCVEELPPSMFITCLYAILDPTTGELRFANAGHNLPYVKTKEGFVELRATGMPLGLMPGMTYEENVATISPGDTMLLYSDGLVEARNPEREMFGFDRLKDYVGRSRGCRNLIDVLPVELERFTGIDAEQEDDVTLVALERVADTTPAAQVASR